MDNQKIKFEKLNNENYASWAYRCKLALQSKEAWTVIEETCPELNEDNQAQVEAWKKKDTTAKFIIGSTISDNQLHLVKRKTTAKEQWEALRSHHHVPTMGSQVRLMANLFSERIGQNGNMVNHVEKMMNIMDELTEMDAPVDNRYAIGAMIASVNRYYSALVTGIEQWPDDRLTLQALNAKLVEEWRKRQAFPRSDPEARRQTERTRFRTEETRIKTEANSNSRTSEASKVQSVVSLPHSMPHRGRINHTPLRVEDMESEDGYLCHRCGKPGHFRSNCPSRHNDLRNKLNVTERESGNKEDDDDAFWYVFVCFNSSASEKEVKENQWLVDSGASAHMCARRELFTTLRPVTEENVCIANGEKVPIRGCGNIRLTVNTGNGKMNVTLHDALWVPELDINIISVSKLSGNGYTVVFTNEECNVIKHNKSMCIGKFHNNLYKLNDVTEERHSTRALQERDLCIHEWHKRLAHRNLADVRKMSSQGIVFRTCNHSDICEACVKGKMARKPFPKKATPVTAALEVIASDVCGPIQVESIERAKYFVTFTDAYSKYTEVKFIKEKSEVTQVAIDYLEAIKTQFGKAPKIFRSDRGTEYTNERFKRYLSRQGIKLELTVGYAPEQNGIAERKNRTLMEAARTMLIGSGLPKNFWTEAVRTAAFVNNRLVNKSTRKTAYELFFGKQMPRTKFYEFGSLCYIMIPDEKRRKLDDKAMEGRFLGYDENSKGFRVAIGRRKVIVTREIKFTQAKPEESDEDDESLFDFEPDSTPESGSSEEPSTGVDLEETSDSQYLDAEESTPQVSEEENLMNKEETEAQEEVAIEEPTRRSQRTNKGVPPRRYHPTNCTAGIKTERDPKSYKEAMNSDNWKQWIKAMNQELQTIKENDTWEEVKLPYGRKAIGCKWVFKTKHHEDGTVKERKARLVAQGFSQKFGTDYDEVFAPVARNTTFRILLSVAGKRNLIVNHYDVKSAFLNGELKEEIYMRHPPGNRNKNTVLKLKKSLYGLKQAAHVWNKALHSVLTDMEFKQSPADKCLYTKQKDGNIVYLLIHVDDILAASNSYLALESTEKRLRKHFEIKNLGKARQYLGIDIERIDGSFLISQTSYINSIVEEAGLTHAKESKLPLDTGYFKAEQSATPEQLKELDSNEEYRKLIGMLLYLGINTRPDIAASIAILSKRVEKPRNIDISEVKRVIRYLKGTQDLKLKLNDKTKPQELIAYSDANWAEDTLDRKSTSGHYCSLNGGTISWFSRKQNVIALSSCEAEYVALAETCKEVTWIKQIAKEFNITVNPEVKVYTDSQSCIALVQNPKQGNRTKHIDLKYHYVKEEVERKNVRLEYVPTESNTADLMTKPLTGRRTEMLRKLAGLTQEHNDSNQGGMLELTDLGDLNHSYRPPCPGRNYEYSERIYSFDH